MLTALRVDPRSLQPSGPAADEIAQLSWVLLVLGTSVFVLVAGLVLAAIVRRRGTVREDGADDLRSDVPASAATRWIVAGGVVLPAGVLSVVLFLSVATMRELPDETEHGLVIDVVGRQWWWSAYYPQHDVAVANEIHVPVGEPVELRLTSADVIHSFWVPGLHGKLDALPDGTNTLLLVADEAGVYGGECAEFCGLQHANMGVLVVADPPQVFAEWIEQQQRPAAATASEAAERGRDLFFDHDCASCHTVRGVVSASGEGPDLTHVASRRTLAADTIANTTDGLSMFVHDPDSVKAGTAMPTARLSAQELEDLVAFLEGLD